MKEEEKKKTINKKNTNVKTVPKKTVAKKTSTNKVEKKNIKKEYLMEDTTEIDMYIASNADIFKKNKEPMKEEQVEKKQEVKKVEEVKIEREEKIEPIVKKTRKINWKLVFLFFASIIFIIVIIMGINYFMRDKEENSENLEDSMKELVESYFDKNIKGKVINIGYQKVTLRTLKLMNYNTTVMKNNETGTECDIDNTYGLVIIENPEETVKENIKYSIEIHLECDK